MASTPSKRMRKETNPQNAKRLPFSLFPRTPLHPSMLPITAGTCWSACTRRVAPSTSPRRILHAFSSSAVDASSRPRISSVGPPSRWVTATPEFRRHQSTSTAAAVQSSRSRSRLLPFAAVTAIVAAGAAWYLLPPSPKLSPDRFTPLKIISVTPLTPETALFKLALPKSLLDAEYGGARAIQSLYVMQPDLQIQRAYTVRKYLNVCLLVKALTRVHSLSARHPFGRTAAKRSIWWSSGTLTARHRATCTDWDRETISVYEGL